MISKMTARRRPASFRGLQVALLFCCLLASLLVAGQAWAINVLQLYIEGGTYDATQTWVLNTGGPFNLWVMGNTSGPGGQGTISGVTLFAAFPDSVPSAASISLTPIITSLSGWTDALAPSSPTAAVRDTSGTTPASLGAPHGIYGSSTDWIPFSLGSLSATTDSVADLSPPCDPATSNCSNTLSGQINAYRVTLTGFPFNSFVHFDVSGTITLPSGNAQIRNAPFSHDAEASVSVVPEPGTLLLLGSGFAGLGGISWRRSRRR